MKLLISDVTAVTMEEENFLIEHAYLAIEENRIVYVGTQKPTGAFEREIDARGLVAMPGLVNTHTHTAMTVLRSYADDMNLQDWLFEKIFPYEDTLTPEVVYDASVNGIKEMLSTGTTCFHDMYFFQEETARAAEELGMRGVLCEGITDGGFEKKKEKTEALLKSLKNGSGRLKVGISPHAVYTCSEETLKACAALAKEWGLFIHTHLSETKTENEDCQKAHGMSPTAWMAQCGLFDVPCVAAHGVYLDEKDREILKNHGVSIAHNPVSNLKLASGVAPVPQMLNEGMNVTLGTDGASSNNNLDMFEEMKLCGILHKGITLDPTVVKAKEVLKMATIHGAKALGYEDLGALKEGYLADVILLNFNQPKFMPNHNTLSNLVYAASGSDVVFTIVDGNMVYEKQDKGEKFYGTSCNCNGK